MLPILFSPITDGEGVKLTAVKRGPDLIITLFADNTAAKIEYIEVYDEKYYTDSGVRPGMFLPEVAKKWGL